MKGLFALKNYKDLLLKCEYHLKIIDENDIEVFEFVLFDLICSLNHLFEWYLKDDDEKMSSDKKKKCIETFYPYTNSTNKKYINKFWDTQKRPIPKINVNQLLVRLLCNGAKHFKSEEINTNNDNEYTVMCGDPEANCGNPNALCGAYNVIYYVEHDDQKYDIILLCTNLIRQWHDFIDNKYIEHSL